MSKHVRHGRGNVRPYLYGNLDLPDCVREVFGAKELERLKSGKGFHIEAEIGDSMVVIEAGESFPPGAGVTKNSIYVYVDDVDKAYQRAMQMGPTSIAPPQDKPYQERACGVKDGFGNTWYIATYTG